MYVSQALDIINNYKPNQVETLADLLPIELIKDAYELTETVGPPELLLNEREFNIRAKARKILP